MASNFFYRVYKDRKYYHNRLTLEKVNIKYLKAERINISAIQELNQVENARLKYEKNLRKCQEEFRKIELNNSPKLDYHDEYFLIINKVDNKYQWRRWILRYHPDKGGNVENCQKMIEIGRLKGWLIH